MDHFRNVLFIAIAYGYESRRVTVIINRAPLRDCKRYCQRASALFELCGWILEWLTAAS